MIAAIALIATAPAPVAQPRFDPPRNKVLRLTTSELRGTGPKRQYFAVDREIVFKEEPGGLQATVTVRRIRQDGSPAGLLFAAGASPFKDRPIIVHLDAAGAILSIDDEEALWQLFCDSIEAMAAKGSGPEGRGRATGKALAAPLRALPPQRRRASLGSAIVALVAGPLAAREPGEQAVKVPAQTFGGAAAILAGQEEVTVTGDQIEIRTSATGSVTPPPSEAGQPASLTVERSQRIDRGRGLVIEDRSIRRLRLGEGAKAVSSETSVTSSLTF